MTEKSTQITEEEALKICQEFLDGPWRKLQISQFLFSVVSGGLSNSMYRCALSEDVVVKNPKVPREVMLRIYGPLQDETNVVVTEATTFMLLAERKLGPKLYGIFPNGRLEEFIPSRIIKSKDYRSMYPTIARELAKIHALEVPVKKIPDFFEKHTKKWIIDIENQAALESDQFELADMYREETKWMAAEMKKTNAPAVYCHNDLQGGNILLRQDSPSEKDPNLVLIDFEFGAYNYRTFDIANQFCEWCFDYNTDEQPYFKVDFEKFPTIEEQTSYIRFYLEQLVEEGVVSPTSVEDEIKAILEEVDLFAMASHLMWSLWSLKMSYLTYDLAHKAYNRTRTHKYFSIKEKYLNHRLSNGTSELNA